MNSFIVEVCSVKVRTILSTLTGLLLALLVLFGAVLAADNSADATFSNDKNHPALGQAYKETASEEHAIYLPMAAVGYGTDFLYVDGYVRVGSAEGPGLAGVKIYRSIASYEGQVVATTNADGYYWAEPLNTQGHQETVSMWAEMPGYSFDPDISYWVYYGYGGKDTLDFVAMEDED
jgi:hypothetical protein